MSKLTKQGLRDLSGMVGNRKKKIDLTEYPCMVHEYDEPEMIRGKLVQVCINCGETTNANYNRKR